MKCILRFDTNTVVCRFYLLTSAFAYLSPREYFVRTGSETVGFIFIAPGKHILMRHSIVDDCFKRANDENERERVSSIYWWCR